MVKKKRSQQENATPVIVDDDELADTPEEDETYTDLCNKLAEIRKDKGVIGYILRSTTQATIDLNEPEKIVEYAIFSSQVLDSSREISDLFELGDTKSVLVEGKETKALCMDVDGNKISIFMEKNTDHADILKKVSP
jgi:predicted regulator of Ras-like GTPase activity (Roadblock/LC7/MglB family)